ncbi:MULTISPECIES: hypothetical protein [unclassified Streptomyces]|uniref:hypothetical protein n=1 Tax=unclassified Streptomyces TaxID=2593676 RepID=UPI0036628D52
MRTLASGVAAATLMGAVLLGAGQANAATPVTAAPASAAATPAPSCVKGSGTAILMQVVTVWMTNNCTTTQRVTPTWTSTMNPAPGCYEIQPGQEAIFQRSMPFASGYRFTGLVAC